MPMSSSVPRHTVTSLPTPHIPFLSPLGLPCYPARAQFHPLSAGLRSSPSGFSSWSNNSSHRASDKETKRLFRDRHTGSGRSVHALMRSRAPRRLRSLRETWLMS